jgi:hypothetical protein
VSTVQKSSSRDIAVCTAAGLQETQKRLSVSLEDAFSYVEGMPHKRLWGILSERALREQNYQLAIKAMVLKDDYKSIQFVKQVWCHQLLSIGQQASEQQYIMTPLRSLHAIWHIWLLWHTNQTADRACLSIPKTFHETLEVCKESQKEKGENTLQLIAQELPWFIASFANVP